jgi:hypothetical protein
MHLSIHNRTLLRGMLAGAVVLSGTSACSRSDRADAGRDTTQTGTAVAPSDTQTNAAIQPGTADTVAAPSSDTRTTTPQTATPSPRPKPSSPAPEAQDSSVESGDQGVSGYQAMGHDTAPAPTTSGDSAQISGEGAVAGAAAPGVSTDTTVSGYEPMARDTSTVLAQGDTAGQAQIDTTTQAEADTATIHAQVDTTAEAPTEVAVEDRPDTGDSTEVLGQVTTDEANYDVEAVGDANADAVGAAQVESTGNIATGADAVALMTREGQPCRVEDSRDVQWDLAGSPATLNPCGTGTMTLPKVQTGEKE